jgi:hypothetical protein
MADDIASEFEKFGQAGGEIVIRCGVGKEDVSHGTMIPTDFRGPVLSKARGRPTT